MKVLWKVLSEDYLNYLRDNHESRIPFSDYGADKFKPFFGSLFQIEDIVYVSQVSHPQNRHLKIKQNLDFYKIYHPTDGRLISVINLNYMFPIHQSDLIDLRYKDIEKYRVFKSQKEKSKYIDLLNIELDRINELPIIQNAQKIYDLKYQFPNNSVSQRSFDFRDLEQACKEYQLLKLEIQKAQDQVATEKEK